MSGYNLPPGVIDPGLDPDEEWCRSCGEAVVKLGLICAVCAEQYRAEGTALDAQPLHDEDFDDDHR